MQAVEHSRSEAVIYEGGRVAKITLNRPEKRNALSLDLLESFDRALTQFGEDTSAAVAILSGSGPSFCAGFDLSEGSASTASTTSDPWADRQRLTGWLDFAVRLWRFPKPIIAKVHGHCLGGGVLLVLAVDLVVVASDCVLGWARLPMGAGFMDAALAHVVGQRRAKEISYIVGSRLSGSQAADIGLVNRAVSPAELDTAANELASQVARTPVSILQIRKAAITRTLTEAGFENALRAGAEWDALAHADPAVDRFREMVRRHGMTAVIDAFESSDDPTTLEM